MPKTVICRSCGERFDGLAIDHHREHGCDGRPQDECDWHGSSCPWNDLKHRGSVDDYQTKTWRKGRTCNPIYMVRQGRDGGASVLYLSLYAPQKTSRPAAPRPTWTD